MFDVRSPLLAGILAGLFGTGLLGSGARAVEPWPAEAWSAAINLTGIEGAGTNDFHEDLSGAFWSHATRRLWVCRNGPSNTASKVWALKENGAGGWVVDTRGGNRGEWTGFGDAEAITQADPASDVVFVMAETEEVIRSYNLSVYGTVQLVRTYNTAGNLPLSGGNGSEGLAFVPDWVLMRDGFVTPAGAPYVSQRGMGGLFFVGHQNGGRVYAFDLSATDSTLTFVGAYLTGAAETAELWMDPTTGRLWVLHGNGVNTIEVCALGSSVVGAERRLVSLGTHDRPTGAAANTNFEGFALTGDCIGGRRSAFLTVDDGGANSLFWFKRFPCACGADFDVDGRVTVADIFEFLGSWFAGSPWANADDAGGVDVADIFGFLAGWFAGCS